MKPGTSKRIGRDFSAARPPVMSMLLLTLRMVSLLSW
jgi:hypothetical protein